jgi:amino acid permease
MNTPSTTQRPSQWQVATIAAIGFAIIWNFWTNWFPPTGVSIAKLSNYVGNWGNYDR